ncbi:MAG TPA: hypothetical protein VES20_22655 [Bryobacteraceae bacterium]|nr:hypothetical protein [Bryobacteraceae bacterium]
MTRALGLLLAASLVSSAAATFEQRKTAVIRWHANPTEPQNAGYGAIAAKLALRQDPAWCSQRLLELLNAGPSGDMFWMFPVTAIAYVDKGQLSAEARSALKRAWKTYMPYRGDTENHLLLYYSSLYLMSQLWPDADWYTGKTSADNMREAAAWIESWVKLTTTRGQGEYDSTHYMGVYLLPMSYLSAWSDDPKMRQRARMMLDYLIADYAVENLQGIYVGAHARTDDKQVLEKWSGVSGDFGYVLFGLGPKVESANHYVLYYLLASGYEPAEILQRIATDRSKPYTHYERKRTRNRWRFNEALHGPVYKTTYMRREYAVSSDQGGVLQPIQQHSWDITWSVPDPRGVHNTLFTLNPHSSLHELQTYFVFGPDFGVEAVVRSKKTYDSPDKLLGGSPYEKILQDQDAVIVLYNVPAETRFPHVNGFFSKDLVQVAEDPSGWIFARGGDAWIAVRTLQPYVWKPMEGGGRRLLSLHRQNGTVLQAAAASEYATLDAFRSAILALPLEYRAEPTPGVRFRSLRGASMEFTWGEPPKLNGKLVDYSRWPLFGGPFLEAEVDSERLSIRHGSKRRLLDFRNLSVKDD